MQNFVGVGVFRGRVIGPVRHMPPALAEPPVGEKLESSTAPETAAASLKSAGATVKAQLQERAARADGAGREVLEATALMATDPMLIKAAIKLVNTGTSAERAIWEAGDTVANMLANLGGMMAERSHDVLDVRSRIVAVLRGVPAPEIPDFAEPFILVAEDLAPADTATLDPSKVIALVTAGGGPQSHTAIIARSLGLPAVVAAVGVSGIADGALVFVDGSAGVVSTEPGDSERSAVAVWEEKSSLLSVFDGEGQLADGTLIPLLANVGGAKDAGEAAAANAQGVGLLRTEFCFLGNSTEPGHDDQVAAYKGVFDAFPGKKVVVRTLDAGADKPLPFLTDSTEPNPALGVRGYRTDLTTPGVLARQLAAIAAAAAAASAEVWVMAPMISTSAEAADFAALCTAAGLRIPGVMVEVPSAALTARHILDQVEFASLGTNDLTQYAMAADRQLGTLAGLNDPWQPAVLALVQATVEGAISQAKHSVSLETSSPKPVGVCGESAADPALAVVLAGLGVSTLSMTPRALPAVAAVLRTVTLEQARALADRAVAAPSAAEARKLVRAGLPALAELGL
ncbi:phosphoenolpyruvate-protein phosphotransferase [Arthrobacter sp. PAMC 25486]|uniref:phosphoenolpyruvate--protein phosphotransferase n=1 Tax=Arthrobacter sp. PAMC 25486 TaxID=1494608 RepID=UPI000535B72F|nr:putative PEP-binding protein [Arthrobacter sp. PAMC 25486]AIY02120.1 phosphoenolpyruvate-protein phosphotransferase [Arthrobacter sp. PAMC 25486]